jgi:hypothetical protein
MTRALLAGARRVVSVVVLAIAACACDPVKRDSVFQRIDFRPTEPYPVGSTMKVPWADYKARWKVDGGRAQALYKGKFAQHPVALAFVLLGLHDTGARPGAPESSPEGVAFFRGAVEALLRDAKLVEDGKLIYGFGFRPSTYKRALPAGWYSAMAQGLTLSVLARAMTEFPDLREEIRTFGDRLLVPLSVDHRRGGMRVSVKIPAAPDASEATYDWYEEYPFPETAPLTLNGFMFTLVGLAEYAAAARSSDALDLFKRGVRSLAALLPYYTASPISLYDLSFWTMPNIVPNLSKRYHGVHTRQLQTLAKWTGSELFACTARVMEAQAKISREQPHLFDRIRNGMQQELKWSHACRSHYVHSADVYDRGDVCVAATPGCMQQGKVVVSERRPMMSGDPVIAVDGETVDAWKPRYGVKLAEKGLPAVADLFFRKDGTPGIVSRALTGLRPGSRYRMTLAYRAQVGAVRLVLINATRWAEGRHWVGNRDALLSSRQSATASLDFWAPPAGDRLAVKLIADDRKANSQLKLIRFGLTRFDPLPMDVGAVSALTGP